MRSEPAGSEAYGQGQRDKVNNTAAAEHGVWTDVCQQGKGYGVDVAPVSLVDQSSGLQRHRLVYQLHILDKF